MPFNFYYTGSQVYNVIQNDPASSLGGYISNSKVSNNKSGNIFSASSYLGITNQQSNVRCIVIQATATHTNLLIGLVPNAGMTNECDVVLGFTILGSAQYTENVPDGESDPYQCQFNDILYMANQGDLANAFSVEDTIETGAYIAIWMKRMLKNNYDGNQTLIDAIAANATDLSVQPLLDGYTLVLSVDGEIPPNPPFVYADRVEYTAISDGETYFQNSVFIGKTISYYLRENNYQYYSSDYTFNTTTGVVSFLVPLNTGERIVLFYE